MNLLTEFKKRKVRVGKKVFACTVFYADKKAVKIIQVSDTKKYFYQLIENGFFVTYRKPISTNQLKNWSV